jgi:HSP20 family protein
MSVPRRPPRTPLDELALLRREIEHLFERLAAWSAVDEPAPGEWFPGVDVYEAGGRLIVQVEVPGLPAEALRVVLSDGQLAVSGERHVRRAAAEGAVFVCLERPHGRFRRTIPLEAAVDVAQAEARLRGGVLTVTLPRLKERRQKEVVIPVTREPER